MNDESFMSPARARSTAVDAGLREHMVRIYNRMTLGVLITAVVAWFVSGSQELLSFFLGGPQMYLVMLAPLAIVFFGFNPAKVSSGTMKMMFVLLSALYGISFSAIFLIFTGESIAKAFFVAASMFAGLSLYGYTTKKDLAPMGTFLVMGMIGLFVLSIINIFMDSSMMSNLIAAAGIVIFGGLTAWDTQKMKEIYSPRMDAEMASRLSWMGALSLYIDFIAMFQYILHFMGNRN